MQTEFGVHTVTARANIQFIKELLAGDLIVIDCELTRVGSKSATFTETMRHADTMEIHASYEVVEVFFDPKTRSSAQIPDPIREALIQSRYGEEGS